MRERIRRWWLRRQYRIRRSRGEVLVFIHKDEAAIKWTKGDAAVLRRFLQSRAGVLLVKRLEDYILQSSIPHPGTEFDAAYQSAYSMGKAKMLEYMFRHAPDEAQNTRAETFMEASSEVLAEMDRSVLLGSGAEVDSAETLTPIQWDMDYE